MNDQADQVANILPCGNCGYSLSVSARGCPRCAWNIEAEKRIDVFVFRIILPLALILLVLIIVLIYLMRTSLK